MSNSNIRFTYLADPKAPERVVTIARTRLPDGNFQYGVSVNSVEVIHPDEACPRFFGRMDVRFSGPVVITHEKFQKSKGRKVAISRMKNAPTVAVVDNSARDPKKPKSAILTVLDSMVQEFKGNVGRIASFYASVENRLDGLKPDTHQGVPPELRKQFRRFAFLSSYKLHNDKEEAEVYALEQELLAGGIETGWDIAPRELDI